jgi:hypothetical protein
MVYLTIQSIAQSLQQGMAGWQVNLFFERMWKELVMA